MLWILIRSALVKCLTEALLTSTHNIHTYYKLWTKICEIRQNFKGDLTKLYEIFLYITMEFPKYSLKSFFFFFFLFFTCKKLVKTTTV